MIEDILDEHDKIIVTESLKDYSKRFNENKPLTRLFGEWKAFIHEIQNGYSFSIFDYVNDLDIRNLIKRAMELTSTRGRAVLQDRIAPLDELFKNVTSPINHPIREYKVNSSFWWYYRIPKTCTGELFEDLIREGILDPYE